MLLEKVYLPADPPSYGHICKRINKLNVDINDHDKKNEDDDKYIIIAAADSPGIKITNMEGQWIDEKWSVLNRKRGYLKINLAINIKTKEFLL